MDLSRAHELMFSVLDGEATAEEAGELERLLAEDAAARDEFSSLQRLFERLRSVRQLQAPQGLAEAAADRRQRLAPPARRGRHSSRGNPGRETHMDPNRSKRSLWIGGGVVVVVGIAIALFTTNFPPDGKNAAGTVAPAQRYRAEQPQAGDVKLGDQSVAQMMQTEAFDRFIKDPSTRALAADANFLALARAHADGLVALGLHPDAVAVLARQVNATKADAVKADAVKADAVKADAMKADAMKADAMKADAMKADAMKADAMKADAFSAFGREAQALRALALAPEATKVMAQHADAVAAMARMQSFASLAANARFADALAANALAANATQSNATSANAQQK
jgi:pentapeptide MXKDX repeat protein